MSTSYQNAIIVFAKEPQPGQVKTRLARESSDAFACAFYEECLKYLFFELKAMFSSQIFACITPKSSSDYFKQYSPDHIRYQHGEDLGERMKNAFIETLSLKMNGSDNNRRFKKVLLIGSDIPQLNTSILSQAYDCLSHNDCVIGPAHDGGYYLIGFTQTGFTDCFQGIRWSTSEVLQKTQALLSHKKTTLLSPLIDIDTISDARKLYFSKACPPSIKAFLKQHQNFLEQK